MPEITRRGLPAEIEASAAPLVPEVDVPHCEVCGASNFVESAQGFDYELLTCRNSWRFVTCLACNHVWLNPRPGIEALNVIYPPSYYAYNYEQISVFARKGKEFLDRLKFRKILSYCPSVPERYLDVGCGNGRYLEVLAGRGVERRNLYGLELDDDTVAALRQRGFLAFNTRVESCRHFDDSTFDLITMFHVIEHVESPKVVIERLAAWLRPGGVLALETPNTDSLDARLFRSGTWGGYHIPRHWHLFNPETLRRLVASTGLSIEAIRFETGHSFWMYSLHHLLRYANRPRPRLAQFFDPLSSVPSLVAFTAFDRFRSAAGAKTSAMLLLARKGD